MLNLFSGCRSWCQASPLWRYPDFSYQHIPLKVRHMRRLPVRCKSHPPDTWLGICNFEIPPHRRLFSLFSPVIYLQKCSCRVIHVIFCFGMQFSITLLITLLKLFHWVPFGCCTTQTLSLCCSTCFVLWLFYLQAFVDVSLISTWTLDLCLGSLYQCLMHTLLDLFSGAPIFITIIWDNVALISNSSCSLLIWEGN